MFSPCPGFPVPLVGAWRSNDEQIKQLDRPGEEAAAPLSQDRPDYRSFTAMRPDRHPAD